MLMLVKIFGVLMLISDKAEFRAGKRSQAEDGSSMMIKEMALHKKKIILNVPCLTTEGQNK